MPYVDNYNKRYATHKWTWWTERDAIGIAQYDPTAEQFYSPTAENHGKKISLFYYKKATKFTEPNDNNFSWTAESEFPGQFHDYLVAKAIALGYEKKPNQLDVATYFHSKFEKGVREGRNYAYRARAGTVKYIKPVDF